MATTCRALQARTALCLLVLLAGCAATAVVSFAPGPACAQPTWTRDGVPMGEVKPTFWGWFVLCGGTG